MYTEDVSIGAEMAQYIDRLVTAPRVPERTRKPGSRVQPKSRKLSRDVVSSSRGVRLRPSTESIHTRMKDSHSLACLFDLSIFNTVRSSLSLSLSLSLPLLRTLCRVSPSHDCIAWNLEGWTFSVSRRRASADRLFVTSLQTIKRTLGETLRPTKVKSEGVKWQGKQETKRGKRIDVYSSVLLRENFYGMCGTREKHRERRIDKSK